MLSRPVNERVKSKHLFTFLVSLLWAFNQINPQNRTVKIFLLKILFILWNELNTQFAVVISWASNYHMVSSACGQDEPNRAIWFATRAGKMERPFGTTRCIQHEKFPRKPCNKSSMDQICSVKMAGYWPRSFFASLWTATKSRSINTEKRTWPISSHLDLTLGQ